MLITVVTYAGNDKKEEFYLEVEFIPCVGDLIMHPDLGEGSQWIVMNRIIDLKKKTFTLNVQRERRLEVRNWGSWVVESKPE